MQFEILTELQILVEVQNISPLKEIFTIPASALALNDPLITPELKLDHLNKFKNNKVMPV